MIYMMTLDSFFVEVEALKVIKDIQENGNGCTKSSSNLSDVVIFIKESICFINSVLANQTQKPPHVDDNIKEWYQVFMKALSRVHNFRKESNFNYQIILSHINHVLINLIKFANVPNDWFVFISLVNFEFLAGYYQTASHKSEFISALIHKTCQCMRLTIQRFERESKSSKESNREYFKLLFLDCIYTSLDTSGGNQKDSLSTCRAYVHRFLLLSAGSGDKTGADDVAKESFQLCCLFYCLQPCCTKSELDACFFKDLFRLVQCFPTLRNRLVVSGGDLMSLANPDDFRGFTMAETKQLMTERIGESLQHHAKNKVSEFMMSVCHVVNVVLQQSETGQGGSLELNENLEASISYLHAVFSNHPTPAARLPQYVGDILSLLSITQLGNSFKSMAMVSSTLFHDLLSLATDVMARDVLCYSGSKGSLLTPEMSSFVSSRSYDMAVITRSRMNLLQSMLPENCSDHSVLAGIAGRLKCSLNLICVLVQKVKKGSGLAAESSAYRTIFKTLKNAVCGVGSLCRQLRRLEKYSAIVSLASPLWPVASLSDMIPHVTHHESLCDAYQVQGNVQAACQVIVQASAISCHLITPALLKTVLKIAKTESNLKLPVLFSRCPEDQSLTVLIQLVKLMTGSYSSSHNLVKHQESLLRHLVDSGNSLTASDKVLVELLLAETIWYHQNVVTVPSCKDSDSWSKRKSLDLLQNCVADANETCQDFKAQAMFLAAEIQHAMICLKMDEASPVEMFPESETSGISSTEDANSHQLLPSALDAPPATPVFGTAFLDNTPVSHIRQKIIKNEGQGKSIPRKDKLPMSGLSDTATEQCGINSNFSLKWNSNQFLGTAYQCLDLWKQWYEAHGCQMLSLSSYDAKSGDISGQGQEKPTFRVDRSLSFLQHLFCVALTHDKPIFAMECLSQAKELAAETKRAAVEVGCHDYLHSLLGQLGLCHERRLHHLESEGIDKTSKQSGKGGLLSDTEDIDVIKLLKDDKSDVSSLVSLARYLFHSHKIKESVKIQKNILGRIESSREKDALTPSLTLQVVELKCLMAECARLLELQAVYQEEGVSSQHPLQIVWEALKYITSVKSFIKGEADHYLIAKGNSVDSWRILGSYLNTLHLAGTIFLQAGIVRTARTYLIEGLKMAQACQLSTWIALFMTSLANLSFYYLDCIAEASNYLQDSSKVMSPPCDQSPMVCHSSDFKCDNDGDDYALLLALSSSIDGGTTDKGLLPQGNIHEQLSWSKDYSPRMAWVHVHRLWLEAEITLQSDDQGISKSMGALFEAKKYTSSLPNCLDFDRVIPTLQSSTSSTPKHEVPSPHKVLAVESLLRLAQAYFHQLSEKCRQQRVSNDLEDPRDSSRSWNDSIEKHKSGLSLLLEMVVREGKKLEYCYESKVIVATAQLMKIQMMYLTTSMSHKPVLDENDNVHNVQNGVETEVDDDDNEEWEDCGDDAEYIAKEVKELKLEEDFWNEKRKQKLRQGGKYKSCSSPSSPKMVESSPNQNKTNHIASITASPSPTKRSSPITDDKENTIPPTPPKVSKGVKMATTPGIVNKRGRAKARNKPNQSSLVCEKKKALQENVTSENNEAFSSLLSVNENSTVDETPPKPVKGRRGKGRKLYLNLVDVNGEQRKQCDSMEICEEIETKSLTISPVMAQLEKLNICVSPIKRKCANEIDGDDDREETSESRKEDNVSTTRKKGGPRRKGPTQTSTANRKCKTVPGKIEEPFVENNDKMERIDETVVTKKCNDKELKPKRTAKNTKPLKETKITVNIRPRRTGRRKENEDSPEFSRDTARSHSSTSPLSLLDQLDYDSLNLDEDNVNSPNNGLISMSDIQHSPVIDSPIIKFDSIGKTVNFDIFSTPLRELRLDSPIEIPRGKREQKRNAGQKHQLSMNEEESDIVSRSLDDTTSRLTSNSPTELQRGFEDSDQEYIPSHQSVETTKGRRAKNGTGKLSLKKNAKKVKVLADSNNSVYEEVAAEENDLGKVSKDPCEERSLSIKSKNRNDTICKPSSAEAVNNRSPTAEDFDSSSISKKNLQKQNWSNVTRSMNAADVPFSMNVKQELEEASEMLWQLSVFPPSYIFSKLSKATALLLRQNKSVHHTSVQTSVAAHLTNSVFINFQHMLTKNLMSKLRVKKSIEKHSANSDKPTTTSVKASSKSSDWLRSDIEEDEAELVRERAVMKEVLDSTKLQWPLEETLSERLQIIPKGWIVVQVCAVSPTLQAHSSQCEVLITRMSSDRPPLTLTVPGDRWKHYECANQVMETCIIHEVDNMTPQKYWTYRYKNDQDMKNLMYFLQEKFFSGLKWLFVGQYSDKKISSIVHESAVQLSDQLKLLQDESTVDVNILKVVHEVLSSANEKDVQFVVASMWPKKVANLVCESVLRLQGELWSLEHGNAKLNDGDVETFERGPVILILDKVFSQIPWESMPILRSESVSRVPSLTALQAMISIQQQRSDSVYINGVGRQTVTTVIDPETNLQSSVKFLKPQFEKYQGWKCQTQQTLTVNALREYLKQELYIYCGHGWGRQFVAGDELQMFRAKAVAVIMGCNSSKMEFAGRSDAHGPPLYFLLAGCPAVIGNLWVVTDKDIDKLTAHFIQTWMASKKPKYLGHLLNSARQVCKMEGLNGFAPVIYGLPIRMN